MSSQILVHTLILLVISAEPLLAASDLRSKESRFKTPIEFYSRLSSPVTLYWVDFQGNEISFGDLNPGSSRVIQTYATHVWRVRDKKSGQLLKSVVVEPRPEFVAIDT